MTAAEIAKALSKPHMAREGEWSACCPAHEDHNPSLSITDGDGEHVLVHCHAGCPQDVVINELKSRGLWPAQTDPRPPRKVATSPVDRVSEIVARSVPIAGTPA